MKNLKLKTNLSNFKGYLLGNTKRELEIVSSILSVELRIVESVGHEVMQESAECETIGPRRGEVGYAHVLVVVGHLATPANETLACVHCISVGSFSQ